MVFYRKYRPQTIDQLDSTHVRDVLSAVMAGEYPHAFLFTGPRGLGKTSAARIVAKVINCEKRKKNSVAPCNTCAQCTSITSGTNMDILEIDAASNRGIDEIRDLREKIRLLPVSAKYKVYIIDEVHMLTTEAFNALLKTLEEPPVHAVFILCTTEPHKVPETILSRCHHIAFQLAGEEELKRSFQRIITGENMKIDKEALTLVMSLADGSFRDGAKILEQLNTACAGKQIAASLVETVFNVASIQHGVKTMLMYFEKKEVKKALELIGSLVSQGVDMKYFIEQLISVCHALLLQKVGVEKQNVINSTLDIEEIKQLTQLLSKAYAEVKYAVLPQLPLELVVLEWGLQEENTAKLSKEAAKIVKDEKPITDVKEIKQEKANDILQSLIDQVKLQNHSVAGLLRGCSIKSFDGKALILETAYKFHKEKLEAAKTQALLEKAMKDATGNSLKISILLKD